MRLQTDREHKQTAVLIRTLRRDLRAADAERAETAEQLLRSRREAIALRAELDAIDSSVVKAHRELLAVNQQLRISNRSLRGQLDDAMGYSAMELGVIDAGGEKALAAAQITAHAAAAKAATPAT
jgi:hypothetical protein